jgi:hypothetical protein
MREVNNVSERWRFRYPIPVTQCTGSTVSVRRVAVDQKSSGSRPVRPYRFIRTPFTQTQRLNVRQAPLSAECVFLLTMKLKHIQWTFMYSLALIIFVASEKKAFEHFPIGSNVNLLPVVVAILDFRFLFRYKNGRWRLQQDLV